MLFGYGVRGKTVRSLLLTRAYLSGKVVVLIFIGLVYYSYRLAPDWMHMYFVKAAEVPEWIVFYILFLYLFPYNAGFFLELEPEKIRPAFAVAGLLLAVTLSVLVVLPVKDRYLRVGTIEEFQTGGGTPLAESPVGRVPGTLSLLLLPLGVGLLFWSRRQKF